MDNNLKALKSGIWYITSNFFIKGIVFITTPIFTRLLTKAEFGSYSNYMSCLSIATIIVTLNLESTLISARYDYKNNKFDEYIFSVLMLSTLSGVVWLIICNIFNKQVQAILGMDTVYINMMLIYLLFLPSINLFQARERYYFEYRKSAITSLIFSISITLLSIVLVMNMDNRLSGRIIGTVIPTVLIGQVFYVFFIWKGRRISFIHWRYAIPICIPYIPHLLSLTLLNSSDRIMINRWCGEEATAVYSLAYTCGMIITMLMTSLNNAFSPWLGEKLNENKILDIRKFSYLYTSGFFIFTIGIMLISPEILLILGGKSYTEAVYVLPSVSMGCMCQFLYTMFVSVEQLKKKTIGMAIASIIAALINILLNWIFIPQIGYLAAAYTTLVGFMCLLFIHMFIVYKLNLAKLFNYKFIIMIICVGLVSMVVITIFYGYPHLRYCLIVVYVIISFYIIYKNKNRFQKILRRYGNQKIM